MSTVTHWPPLIPARTPLTPRKGWTECTRFRCASAVVLQNFLPSRSADLTMGPTYDPSLASGLVLRHLSSRVTSLLPHGAQVP